MRAVLASTLRLLVVPSDRAAQRFQRGDGCEQRWGGDSRERWCEEREVTLPRVPSRLEVSGGRNGGISVYGWNRETVVVRARLEAWARSEREARDLVREMRVVTDGRIRAEGPDARRDENWSVSYEIMVPHRIALDLETHNGGTALEGIDGTVRFNTVNGGISLRKMAGDVRGETANGGVRVQLDGAESRESSLDVETRNGGVSLDIPRGYSAELETDTVNGGVDVDFPIRVQGRIDKRITATIGRGGPRVRVRTTNGGVRIREA